ncbi:MAG: hypothetical protein WDO56_09955 [Gammaproteobacteria bacterium]
MSTTKLGIVEAFKSYGAVLKNFRKNVSAIAEDGALVVSCPDTSFRKAEKALRYEGFLSKWDEANAAGRDLLSGHLTKAVEQSLAVRLVINHRGPEGSVSRTGYFHVRPDLVGRVAEFDGDRFAIDFTRPVDLQRAAVPAKRRAG